MPLLPSGTPLGDPIEVNAGMEVLLGESATASRFGRTPHTRQPVVLTALKSRLGHAEPAAGILGLLSLALQVKARVLPRKHPSLLGQLAAEVALSVRWLYANSIQGSVYDFVRALAQVKQRATHAILHLRQVNPHLSSALLTATKYSAGSMTAASMPREASPWCSSRLAWHQAAGVSGFAFMVGKKMVVMLVHHTRCVAALAAAGKKAQVVTTFNNDITFFVCAGHQCTCPRCTLSGPRWW